MTGTFSEVGSGEYRAPPRKDRLAAGMSPACQPLRQVAVALLAVGGRQRRIPDRRNISPDVLTVKTDGRMPYPAGPAGVQVRAPGAHRIRTRPLGVITTEVQPVRNHAERPVQTQLGVDGPVSIMMTAMQVRPEQDLSPDDTVGVVIPAIEQHAPEPVRRPRGVRGHRVREYLRHVARRVGHRLPAMSEHCLRMLIERVDAAFKEIARVQVIMGGHFDQFPPGLPDDEVVVRVQSDVVRLTDVAYPGVLLRVAIADVRQCCRSRRCPK